MEIVGVESISFRWGSDTEKFVSIVDPVEATDDPDLNLTTYVTSAGVHAIVRHTWDVCVIYPTIMGPTGSTGSSGAPPGATCH